MEKFKAFVKLWWGKFFSFTANKVFVALFPLIAFLLVAVFADSLLALIFFSIQLVSAISKKVVDEPTA
jgi:hypothetical protein